MYDLHALGGANASARPVLRPTAVHLDVSGPSRIDPDWRLDGTGPGGTGRTHIWITGALADTILDAGGFVTPPESDGSYSLAVFLSGDGGGGVILRLVPAHELAAEHAAANRATRAKLITDGDLERQRALDAPVRGRRIMLLHDGGPVAASLAPLFADLTVRGITVVNRAWANPEDPGALPAALALVRDHIEWCRPDLMIVACEHRRRGLPVRALSDPGFLTELARLPIPVVTMAGPEGALIDEVAWRNVTSAQGLAEFFTALLALELRLAEPERLEAITDLLTTPDAPDTSSFA